MLAVPVNRVLLAYARVLNDRNKDFLLSAEGLFLAPNSTGFWVFFFCDVVLGTVKETDTLFPFVTVQPPTSF